MAAAAVDNHNATVLGCLDDPNFGTICSFIEKFGEACNLGDLPFDYLQEMLENTTEVPPRLTQIHIQLLRRVYKSVNTDKWEKQLAKFGHSYNPQDGWEIERFGYKKAKIQTKLRLLKTLLEAQFDFNVKFKNEVNKLPPQDLRRQPIGRDCEGQLYWYQVDPDANLRIYREDVDDETWEVVASNREEMLQLIEQLSSGEVKKNSTLDDENGDAGEMSPKEIILDTGKVDDPNDEDAEDDEDNNGDDDDDAMQIDETYCPPIEERTEPEPSETDNIRLNPSISDTDHNINIQATTLSIATSQESIDSHPPPISTIEEIKLPVLKNDPENSSELSTKVDSFVSTETSNLKSLLDKTKSDDGDLSNKPTSNNNSKSMQSQLNNKSVDKKREDVPPLNQDTIDLQVLKQAKNQLEAQPSSCSKHFKEPKLLPPPSKLLGDADSSNNDIWNPAVQECSKPFIDNLKLLNTCEVNTNVKYQHKLSPIKPDKSSNWSQPVVKGFKREPSPLENLKLFTAKMSVEPNTLTANLRKVTDVLEEEAGFDHLDLPCRKETDYGEKFIKPETSSSSKETDVQRFSNDSVTNKRGEGSKMSFQEPSKFAISPVERRFSRKELITQFSTFSSQVPKSQFSETVTKSGLDFVQVQKPLLPKLISEKESIDMSSFQDQKDNISNLENIKADTHSDSIMVDPVSQVQQDFAIPEANVALAAKLEICISAGEPNSAEQRLGEIPDEVLNKTIDSTESLLNAPVKTSQTIDDKELKKVDNTCVNLIEDDIKTEVKVSSLVSKSVTDIQLEAVISFKKEEIAKVASDLCQDHLVTKEVDNIIEAKVSISMVEASETQEDAIKGPESQISDIKTDTAHQHVFINKSEKIIVPEPDLVSATSSTKLTTQEEVEPICETLMLDSSTGKNAPINILENVTSLHLELTSQIIQQDERSTVKLTEEVSGTIVVTSETELSSTENSGSEIRAPKYQSMEDIPKDTSTNSTGVINATTACLEEVKLTNSSQNLDVETAHKIEEMKKQAQEVLDVEPTEITSFGSSEKATDITNVSKNDLAVTATQETTISSEQITTTTDAKKDGNLKPIESQVEVVETPIVKSSTWLVGYDDSSSDDDICIENKAEIVRNKQAGVEASEVNDQEEIRTSELSIVENSSKRKPDDEPNLNADFLTPEKKSKLDEIADAPVIINPILGEAIEEEMMIITGEGSGAELQGGNDESMNSSMEADDGKTTKGRSRGRPKRKEGPTPPAKSPGSRRKSNELNDLTPTERSVTEINGSSNTERPMRQSRRIAHIREKEEVERRKLEEEHLAQLKKAQLQKQQKLKEKDVEQKKPAKHAPTETPKSVKAKTKQALAKSQKEYLPTPSASESESGDEDLYQIPEAKKRGRKPKKNGEDKFKKGVKPWLHSSSEEEDEAVEEEEEAHEEEEEELVFDKSDHEFSPESDLGEDDEISPRHARTVKIGPNAEDKYATTVCDKCTKGDHPEWILLCDVCDKGWHASCVRPQLWVIPEGEWFCPPCQHDKLVERLGESLVDFDKILKKRDNDELRKKRLAFVGISLENVLPPEKPTKPKNSKHFRGSPYNKYRQRRRILSDEDESDTGNNFIDDKDENEESKSSRDNSDDDSDDEPMYKLRARKATKTFNFKEYDDMINSALQEDDYEPGENEPQEAKSAETLKNDVRMETEEIGPKDVSGENAESETVVEADDKEDKVDRKTEDDIDKKENQRLEELEKASHRKTRRRLNDLDGTSDEDSDEDFKGSNGDDEDEDEENQEEDDSEWSGDREADDSDGSIARRGRRGKKEGKYGRTEKYLDVGAVRRSTRRSRAIQYDESDQEDDDEDAAEPWNSNENSEESASLSESDDETWGKKKNPKKAPFNPPKSSMRKFFLPQASSNPKSGLSTKKKKKKKKLDDEEEDRPWNKGGGKPKKVVDVDESVQVQQRTTRGKKINFKDILDSGESDDDGNIRPKRRRIISESDDSNGPSSSKKLVAANLRAAAVAKKESKKKSKEVDTELPSLPPVLTKQSITTQEEEGSAEVETASNNIKTPDITVPEEELKPVPAPPYPPVRNQLREALKKSSDAMPKPHVPQAPSTNLLISEILATPPVRGPGLPKSIIPPVSPINAQPSHMPLPSPGPLPVHTSPGMHVIHPQHLPGNIPGEMPRIPDPGLFQRMQAMRAFQPVWGRSPLPPPPYGNHANPPPPTSSGKPPPLNSIPFMSQSSVRSPYPTPPPLRIPSPNPAPLQSFHHFKRDVGMPMYRLPPNLSGIPPRSAGLLPQMHPGLGHPNPHLERFYGPPFGVPSYGIPPSQTQSQPLFSNPQPYNYRTEESFKDEQTHASGGHITTSHSHGIKDELNAAQGSGEFGGLVSYFSSQRGDDDMEA